MNKLDKEELEKLLGYEIVDCKFEPIFVENILTGIDIKLHPKQSVEFINLNFKILPTNEQIR